MLEKSDTGISETLKLFDVYELEIGLLVPTLTELTKSIMDATASVRDFLRDFDFHDYDASRKAMMPRSCGAYYVYPWTTSCHRRSPRSKRYGTMDTCLKSTLRTLMRFSACGHASACPLTGLLNEQYR